MTMTSPIVAPVAPVVAARRRMRHVPLGTPGGGDAVGSRRSRCVRSYAASGGSYLAGEMHPFGNLRVSGTDVVDSSSGADMLVVSLCEDNAADFAAGGDAVFAKFGEGLGAVVHDLMKEAEFKGKAGTSAFTRLPAGGFRFKHVGVVGLGKPKDITAETWTTLGSAATAAARKAKCESVLIGKYWMGDDELAFRAKVESIALGACVGSFDDQRFKSEPAAKTLAAVTIITQPGVDVSDEITAGKAAASGVVLTKQLVAAPPNVCTPTALAEIAAAVAAEFPDVMSLKVLEKDECEKLGMGSFLGVAEASDEPPKFIHLTYTPKPATNAAAANAKVAVVGKGLTFDSGGYNIKAGAGSMIEMMKFDMGGAGAVLGAARVIAETQPEVGPIT